MKIAITGGRGEMGHAVASLALERGHEVLTIDHVPPGPDGLRHANLTTETFDVTSYEMLEEAVKGSDALVHLAAFRSPGGRPPQQTHNTNVVASYNALTAASVLGITHVCQASSINATGASFSRSPRYDYFPLDEEHPTYNEDPYALSKWICEAQADSVSRCNETMAITSLRLHMLVKDRETAVARHAERPDGGARELWGYTTLEAVARAALAALDATWHGHEVVYTVAPTVASDDATSELCRMHYPDVPLRSEITGTQGLYDCRKARRVLGWSHDA